MNIKVDGKKYTCINSWDECTTLQYEQLMNAEGFVDILSSVSDIPKDVITEMRDLHVRERLLPEIDFLTTPPDFNGEVVRRMVVYGKKRKVPKNLNKITLAQKLAAESLINENTQMEKVISKVVAIFMCPSITGERYDDAKSEEFARDVIGPMPIKMIYPLGRFFLKKYVDLQTSGKKALNIPNLLKNKKGPVLTNLTNSVHLVCFIAWPVATLLNTMKLCT